MEFFVDGTRVIRADWPELAGPNAAHLVSQPALLEMFVEAALRHSTFKLRMGAAVRDVRVTSSGVELHIRSGAGEETVLGDAVVAADGRGSLVRARANLKVERLPFPFDFAWFSAPIPEGQRHDPRFQGFINGGRSAVLYPSWDDRLRVGINIPSHEVSRLAVAPKTQLLEKLARVVGEPYASFFWDRADDISEPVILKVLFGRCPRWWAPRTLLLGDAAHPMSPVRAQGINLALRDAIVAANHLVPAIESSEVDAFDRATPRIQQEREPEIVESQRLQVLTARPPPPARSALLRATLLPVLRRTGIVKRLFLKAEIPLRHGVVPVRLVV
jgi:2-polyprenyl-6-methoxyphenol hydroxylase-like FAD-dependent oxidoreductase